MKQVLLTIDGMTPDQKAFQYAVALCKRIKAELSIFQIIRPQYYRKYMEKIRKNTFLARTFIKSSMVAATFAEAGEHETALEIMDEASKEMKRLMSESEKSGVHCHFSMKSGNPEKEIIDYVDKHRNVVLTIYDAANQSSDKNVNVSEKEHVLGKIKKNLSIPLVTIHN